MTSTLSNITDNTESTDPLDSSRPTDEDGQPLSYGGNLAALGGFLHEIKEFYIRHDLFRLLFEQRAVLLPNGKVAVDDMRAVQFLKELVKEPVAYDFDNPPPPTPARIQAQNTASPKSAKDALADDFSTEGYPYGKESITKELRKLCASILSCFTDVIDREALRKQCKGDGFTLLEILRWRFVYADQCTATRTLRGKSDNPPRGG